ncbi:hypothetical protein [Alicyclobacillus acidoterrestris]|uniref:Uncharacterized protein n=1 Tax=Alicyclobacillus acidoterrestris (strain ATCC 49025 / DSM 3922 / CIP 106132 / NCIMB 13137 / GD3B) TaxID=1356854 RepID=T0D858_ALIAG|nr:hypothetical protein [Alicyclobacillus acidoterrestris]EPZ47697.1 hypothetical protein N007_05435 [Alicyclobacillus acidoterrestris ATCC 49025]UNO47988.1 hypothetical protein K1I37_15040 [Alicyclobacillus acidoterrestris]
MSNLQSEIEALKDEIAELKKSDRRKNKSIMESTALGTIFVIVLALIIGCAGGYAIGKDVNQQRSVTLNLQ